MSAFITVSPYFIGPLMLKGLPVILGYALNSGLLHSILVSIALIIDSCMRSFLTAKVSKLFSTSHLEKPTLLFLVILKKLSQKMMLS